MKFPSRPPNDDDIDLPSYNSVLHYIASKCNNIDDINDIIQEVYYQFYKYKMKAHVDEGISTTKLLIHLSKKQLSKYYRKKKLHSNLFVDNAVPTESSEERNRYTEETAVNSVLTDKIWEELNKAGDPTLKIFRLKFSHDMSFDKISQEISMPESSVKTIYYRMLRKLKKKFRVK